jgi:hypothetical protein
MLMKIILGYGNQNSTVMILEAYFVNLVVQIV